MLCAINCVLLLETLYSVCYVTGILQKSEIALHCALGTGLDLGLVGYDVRNNILKVFLNLQIA